MDKVVARVENWQVPGLPGFVEERRGRASSRILWRGRNYRRTHKVSLAPKNRRIIERLHREFYEDILCGKVVERQQRAVNRKRSAIEAKKEFLELRAGKDSVHVLDSYRRAFSHYIGTQDFVVSYETIYRRLAERETNGRQLANETKRKYLQSIRAWTRWLVARGYVSLVGPDGAQRENPVDVIGIPATPDPAPEHVLTPDEVAGIVAHYRRRAAEERHGRIARNYFTMAAFIELAYLTGMRSSELIRARWEDVDSEVWKVWGKSAPKKGQRTEKEKRYREPRNCRDEFARTRFFPLVTPNPTQAVAAWQMRIRELLEELRPYAARHNGFILPYRNTQNPNEGLKRGLQAVGIDRGYSFRALRKAARWRFEQVLRFDPLYIADLLGHSATISLTDYRKRPGREDMIRGASQRTTDSNSPEGFDVGLTTTP